MSKDHLVPTSFDPVILRELLPSFINDVRCDLEILIKYSKHNDLKSVKEYAHKIKGVAMCYGAQFIEKAAGEIEEGLSVNDNYLLLNAVGRLSEELREFEEAHNNI